MNTINTRALRATREDCARLAEAAIAAGRASEIPALIRAGVSADRIASVAATREGAHPPKTTAAAGAGFDQEASRRRFEEQTGRAAPPP